MAFKFVVFCALAVFVQKSLAGPYGYRPSCGCNSGVIIKDVKEIEELSYVPIGKSCGNTFSKGISSGGSCVSIDVPTYGGAFQVTSIGPVSPSGIAVAMDVALAGDLELSGVLPYLSAVEFDGQFASKGDVPVAYSCGDIVDITEQIGGSVGIGSVGYGSAGYGSVGYGSVGYGGSSIGGYGCNAVKPIGGSGCNVVKSIGGCGCNVVPSFGGCGCKY